MEEEREIKLMEKSAVFNLPEDAVAVRIEATVYVDGDFVTVHKQFGPQEVAHAFAEADKNYIPDDAVFAVTEKGLASMREQDVSEITHGPDAFEAR